MTFTPRAGKRAYRFPPLLFDRIDRLTIRRTASVALVCVGLLAAETPAPAAHGLVHIPSFAPQEISIATLDPTTAAAQLEKSALQAYVGTTPRFAGAIPEHLKALESLEALLVLSFNPASSGFKQRDKRCAVAAQIRTALEGKAEGVTLSPYPVTPFHPDYLQHLDQVEQAKAKGHDRGSIDGLRFRAQGERAQALVQTRWRLDGDNWDVTLQEVPIDQLMPIVLNGWLGPPWMKQGWFHAYKLLAPAVSNAEEKQSADAIYRRLVHGEYEDLTQQLNLERRLLTDLTRGCDRVVLGYTSRREYYDDNTSDGVENIAFDSQLGLNSPVFIRTAKLKDFPWNGLLRLGMKQKPEAAWNPIAGFTDAPGRLLWSTLSDAALLPLPYSGSWIPNRVDPEVALAWRPSGGFKLPPDAMLPQAGTGMLKPVGEGRFAFAKIVYQVRSSRFHDGSNTEVADLLYPYVLAYRWGIRTGNDDKTYDPTIESATTWMREQLIGLKVLRVQRTVSEVGGDVKVPKQIAVVEVYVNYAAKDPLQVAALAPPWSPVPWHVLVLMEEAVQRGFTAFSKEQAERLAVSWLDLARDESLHTHLQTLIEEFEQKAYRPAALTGLVSAEAARLRWRALKQFGQDNRHLLVTNGPYRLKQWSNTSAVVQVDRELTYPHGVGSFDHYAYPPRALITEVKREANRVLVSADVEMLLQQQRSRVMVRERLTPTTLRGLYAIRPDSRYLVLGPDGSVVQAGTAKMASDGRFVAELPKSLARGRYTFVVAIYLDGNSINPTARMLSFEASAS